VVSGQLQAPAALPAGIKTTVATEEEAGWMPAPVTKFRMRTQDLPARSQVAIPPTSSRLLEKKVTTSNNFEGKLRRCYQTRLLMQVLKLCAQVSG
jgi:hypothetical protein